jgi:virginiamycin B lyase
LVSRRLLVAVAVLLVLLIAGGVVGAFVLQPRQHFKCGPQSSVQTTKVAPVTFDAVTEYPLPQNRSPNAITVAPDGSVWFGELGVPGVGHLYPNNGTLVEYRWPSSYIPLSSSSRACFDVSDTWGVALWNGMVWATYQDNSSLVGLNPSSDASQIIQLKSGSLPYTLAVGPDGALWFTELSYPAQVGRVDPATHQVTYYSVPAGADSASAYLLFQNSTLGYVLAIYPYTGGGNLFSFDPAAQTPSFDLVGGNQSAGVNASNYAPSPKDVVSSGPFTPTSVAVGEGGIWLAEHAGSMMAYYDEGTGQWSLYPTSSVGYIPWTLPYFDVSNGSVVWFNEHYGNRLGEICCNRSALTEYSFSDPPANNSSGIQNNLSIAQAADRVWFTSWTGDYVGYVDTTYRPPFSISLSGSPTVSLQPGATAQLQVELRGDYPKSLGIQFSDTEQSSGTPKFLSFTSSVQTLPSLDGSVPATMTIAAAKGTQPGRYTALVTLTDGLVYRSVYLSIVVQ